MRRKFFQIAGIFLILPLLGCTPSIDVSSDPANPITVTGVREGSVASPDRAVDLLSAGETGTLLSSRPTVLAPGSLPFVRSRPKLVPPFPLVLNRTVQAYIDNYVAQPEGLRESFQRSSPFMPEMLSLLRDDGLPPDLVYLTFAESAFSDTGAGPWQLSKDTARRYGLTINHWLDERRDPIKSTRAAANYLAELYDQTGDDWRMTLVAWNNGDGGVDRYLRLMTAPYERLVQQLPRRTRALMNRFMAVALIARHAKEYGLDMVSWAQQAPRYRMIAVNGNTSLRTLAASNHISIATLQRLNPALLSNHTPPGESYPVRVPDNSAEAKLATASF
jgi:membrane-bound lytic murein transglycosylase D